MRILSTTRIGGRILSTTHIGGGILSTTRIGGRILSTTRIGGRILSTTRIGGRILSTTYIGGLWTESCELGSTGQFIENVGYIIENAERQKVGVGRMVDILRGMYILEPKIKILPLKKLRLVSKMTSTLAKYPPGDMRRSQVLQEKTPATKSSYFLQEGAVVVRISQILQEKKFEH